jgi:hypothetical protein
MGTGNRGIILSSIQDRPCASVHTDMIGAEGLHRHPIPRSGLDRTSMIRAPAEVCALPNILAVQCLSIIMSCSDEPCSL